MDGVKPVFQQEWFAEIATRGQWKRSVEICSKGKAVASLPYSVRWKKFLFLVSAGPYWAHINGPIVDKTLSEKQRAAVLTELAAKLPRWVSFQIVCAPVQDKNALVAAFEAAGFEHTIQTTYQENPDDPDVLHPDNPAGIRKKTRKHLRNAERKLFITENVTADEFIDFYKANLEKAGSTSYAPLSFARDIIAKGQSLSLPRPTDPELIGPAKPARQAVVFAAKDQSGVIVAAIACLFDRHCCYYWMSTHLHSGRQGDAVKVLIMRARRRAQYLGLTFDCDGVTTPGTNKLYSLLKFPNAVERDVFTREARIYGFLQRKKRAMKLQAASLRRAIFAPLWLRFAAALEARKRR